MKYHTNNRKLELAAIWLNPCPLYFSLLYPGLLDFQKTQRVQCDIARYMHEENAAYHKFWA
jgi:hypothetical protein